MEKSELKDRRYSCKLCNKIYSSANSLWNHNNKFHKSNAIIMQSSSNHNAIILQSSNNHNSIINQPIDKLELNKICKYCKKKFSHRNNKWRHQKICKTSP